MVYGNLRKELDENNTEIEEKAEEVLRINLIFALAAPLVFEIPNLFRLQDGNFVFQFAF